MKYKEVDSEDLSANVKIKTFSRDVLVSTLRPNKGAISIITEDVNNLFM